MRKTHVRHAMREHCALIRQLARMHCHVVHDAREHTCIPLCTAVRINQSSAESHVWHMRAKVRSGSGFTFSRLVRARAYYQLHPPGLLFTTVVIEHVMFNRHAR